MCCGTKRLVEIECPSECPYLGAAREHPAAITVRRQQRDLERVMRIVRDFSDKQSQLFVLLARVLTTYGRDGLERLIDEDVGEAAASLASTFETASRGVIYEHRPASLPAARLVTALRDALSEAAGPSSSAFDRDVAVVLRRIEEGVRELSTADTGDRRALLGLLERVIRSAGPDWESSPASQSRLIVP